MRRFYRVIILGIFITLPSFSFREFSDWELKKDENGIKVYTRYSENSSIKEVRVENIVEGSLSSIVGVLLNTKKYPDWIYACHEARILKSVNEHEQYQYTVTAVPWPFSDRDLITHFNVEQDSVTKVVTVSSVGMPGYIPEADGKVRVNHFHSRYTLIPIAGNKVEVDFELYVNPGGNIPAWLINANIVVAPYNTSAAMILQLPQYANTSYSFIKEK